MRHDDGGRTVTFEGPSVPSFPNRQLRDNTPTTGSTRLADRGGLVLANVRTNSPNNLEIVATNSITLLQYDVSVSSTPTAFTLAATTRPQLTTLLRASDSFPDIAVGLTSTVRFFDGSAAGLVSQSTALTVPNNSTLGSSVAAGDLDDDGDDDLVVGSPNANSNNGAMTRFINNSSGTFASGGAIAGVGTDENFGAAVAVGDINKDRRPDVVACATGLPTVSNGRCIVYGSNTISSNSDFIARLTLTDVGADEGFGAAIPVIADFNGDGAGDLILPLPEFNGFIGELRQFNGSPANLVSPSIARLAGTTTGEWATSTSSSH